MTAYKPLKSEDIIISPLEVNKGFTFKGGEFSDSNVGIDRFLGTPGNYLDNKTTTGDTLEYQKPEVLIYHSTKHLYYHNYISGSYGEVSSATTASFNTDGTVTGPVYQTNYYNYNETTLNPLKTFPTSSTNNIGVISIPTKLFGDKVQPYSFKIENPDYGYINDNGEGILILTSGSRQYYAGNIIYEHGMVILTQSPTEITEDGLYDVGLYDVISYDS